MIRILKGTMKNWSNIGIHLVRPVTKIKLDNAVHDAVKNGYPSVYVHPKGSEEGIKRRMRADKMSQEAERITRTEITELLEYYRFTSADTVGKHARMIKASKWFHARHPKISEMRAYKELDRELHGR